MFGWLLKYLENPVPDETVLAVFEQQDHMYFF